MTCERHGHSYANKFGIFINHNLFAIDTPYCCRCWSDAFLENLTTRSWDISKGHVCNILPPRASAQTYITVFRRGTFRNRGMYAARRDVHTVIRTYANAMRAMETHTRASHCEVAEACDNKRGEIMRIKRRGDGIMTATFSLECTSIANVSLYSGPRRKSFSRLNGSR